jgi:cytochrome c1
MKSNTLKSLAAVAVATAALAGSGSIPAIASSEGGHAHIERQQWSFGGLRGKYDKAQLQRGFQIYKDVCSACHGLRRVNWRNLVQPGGPEFPEESVKALAAEWPNKITDGPDDNGKMFERPAKLSDPILGPYKNDNEARAAQNGALPPDLALIAKARKVEYTGTWYMHPFAMLKDIVAGYQEGGPDYLYALLTGYGDPPKDFHLNDGMTYNSVFPGNQIGMPPPMAKDNFTKYQDGSGSLEENARDVAAFLAWASDPTLNTRKSTGLIVLLYLLATTVLLYIGKRRLWADLH